MTIWSRQTWPGDPTGWWARLLWKKNLNYKILKKTILAAKFFGSNGFPLVVRFPQRSNNCLFRLHVRPYRIVLHNISSGATNRIYMVDPQVLIYIHQHDWTPVSSSCFMSDINLNLPVLLFLLKHTSVAISFRVLATMTPKKRLMLASIQESPGISQSSVLSITLQDL